MKERSFVKVQEVVAKYGKEQSALIPILQEVQDEYRYLPEEIMMYVATAMDLPPAVVYGVATFYAQFSLEPKGKYVIRICDGTACHVRSSMPILEAIQKRLQLTDEKITTDDLLFTCQTVSCLGACGLAPVVMVNEKVYGKMSPDKMVAIIDELAARKEEEAC